MAKKNEVLTDNVGNDVVFGRKQEESGQPLAELQFEATVLAENGDTVEILDAELLFAALDTITLGFKQLKTLFNPADSRGDAFVNSIGLLENQIAGLRTVLDLGEDPKEE